MASLNAKERGIVHAIVGEAARTALEYDADPDEWFGSNDPDAEPLTRPVAVSEKVLEYITGALWADFPNETINGAKKPAATTADTSTAEAAATTEAAATEEAPTRRWQVVFNNDCPTSRTDAPVCGIMITALAKNNNTVLFTAIARPLRGDSIIASPHFGVVYTENLIEQNETPLQPLTHHEGPERIVSVGGLDGSIDGIVAFLQEAKVYASTVSFSKCTIDALFDIVLNGKYGFVSPAEHADTYIPMAAVVAYHGGGFSVGDERLPGDKYAFACGHRRFIETYVSRRTKMAPIREEDNDKMDKSA